MEDEIKEKLAEVMKILTNALPHMGSDGVVRYRLDTLEHQDAQDLIQDIQNLIGNYKKEGS